MKDRQKIIFVAFLQVTLSLADLIGVALTGILGALAITGIESRKQGSRISQVLELLKIGSYSLQTQAMILAILTTLILLGRTIFSLFLTRKMVFFLGKKGVELTQELLAKLLTKPLDFINKRSSQDLQFRVTNGVEAITTGIIATFVNMISDCSLLIVLTIGLLIVSPILAIVAFITFALVGLVLNKIMKAKSIELGRINSTTRVQSSERIMELFQSFREVVVRNRKNYYLNEISSLRYQLSNALSETVLMPNTSKYVIEITLVIGSLVIGATQFALLDATHAVATLTVFMAAGSRIAPAVLRLQQGYLIYRSNQVAAVSTLVLSDELSDATSKIIASKEIDLNYSGFSPTIELINVSKSYVGQNIMALHNVNLQISAGTIVAIVGPSGAGKTTLVDVILGVIEPNSGSALISGLPPADAIAKWPGAVAYVPQDILIMNSDINSNVSLGFSSKEISERMVWSALTLAHLDKFVHEKPEGIFSPTGERGSALSGGQRQRLGIARALVTLPKILVLDEATSALDSETENAIAESIESLRGSTTILLIAHRLSTVRNADCVIYIDSGQILAVGSFDEVRKKIPNFDRQAKLMGI